MNSAETERWARCQVGPAEHLVVQGGRRRLWDEVEDSCLRWVEWGSPGRDRFGLTVGREQHVWLDRPSNVIGPVSAKWRGRSSGPMSDR